LASQAAPADRKVEDFGGGVAKIGAAKPDPRFAEFEVFDFKT
jgi:hypothetical protein